MATMAGNSASVLMALPSRGRQSPKTVRITATRQIAAVERKMIRNAESRVRRTTSSCEGFWDAAITEMAAAATPRSAKGRRSRMEVSSPYCA